MTDERQSLETVEYSAVASKKLPCGVTSVVSSAKARPIPWSREYECIKRAEILIRSVRGAAWETGSRCQARVQLDHPCYPGPHCRGPGPPPPVDAFVAWAEALPMRAVSFVERH